MKKSLYTTFLSIFTLSLLVSVFAEPLTKESVPGPVLATFNKDHSSATAQVYGTFTNASGTVLYEIKFKKDGKDYRALYEASGAMYRVDEYLVDVSEIPQAARDTIKQEVPDATVKRVAKVTRGTSGEGVVEYHVEFKGAKTMIFDLSGVWKPK
jgi:hypothetical protein